MHGSGVGGAGAGDQLTTRVITLRYESAAQMVNVLRPLITPNNTIAAFPGTNALVITDYAENLRRIERIVASLDQAPRGRADDRDAASTPPRSTSCRSSTGCSARRPARPPPAGRPPKPQQRVTIVADPRSNSVMLRSDNSARAARVKALIEQLDTPGRPGGNMFIVYLQERRRRARGADAARADVGWQRYASSSTQPSAIGSTLARGGRHAAAPMAAPRPRARRPRRRQSVHRCVRRGRAAARRAHDPGRHGEQRADRDGARAPVQQPARDHRAARRAARAGVRRSADRRGRRRQGRAVRHPVAVPGRPRHATACRASAAPTSARATAATTSSRARSTWPRSGRASTPASSTARYRSRASALITNLAFLARALEQSVGANILSTPTLLTLDNEEARIIVGQNIPFVTGQYATTGGNATVQPFQTIERKDIGVLLRVKPQITEGGAIRLLIYQEVSRIDNTVRRPPTASCFASARSSRPWWSTTRRSRCSAA